VKKFSEHGCFIPIPIHDYIVSVASCFDRDMMFICTQSRR